MRNQGAYSQIEPLVGRSNQSIRLHVVEQDKCLRKLRANGIFREIYPSWHELYDAWVRMEGTAHPLIKNGHRGSSNVSVPPPGLLLPLAPQFQAKSAHPLPRQELGLPSRSLPVTYEMQLQGHEPTSSPPRHHASMPVNGWRPTSRPQYQFAAPTNSPLGRPEWTYKTTWGMQRVQPMPMPQHRARPEQPVYGIQHAHDIANSHFRDSGKASTEYVVRQRMRQWTP